MPIPIKSLTVGLVTLAVMGCDLVVDLANPGEDVQLGSTEPKFVEVYGTSYTLQGVRYQTPNYEVRTQYTTVVQGNRIECSSVEECMDAIKRFVDEQRREQNFN